MDYWVGLRVILSKPNHCLPRRVLLADIEVGWSKAEGSKTKAQDLSIKSLSVGLSYVGTYRLPGWCSRDKHGQWFEIVCEMTQNRS